MALIHKEGFLSLSVVLILLVILNAAAYIISPPSLILVLTVSIFIFAFFLQFFRNPLRKVPKSSDDFVYAPADGKVVVVEKTLEKEFFREERIQISIFMSPINVHVNRSPIKGLVKFYKYHPGKYLVAWHPKSSEENERTTIVIEGQKGTLLMRQIAGLVARRIIFYPKEGDKIGQGDEIGFIKFGSRVDLFLPLNSEILVKPGDKVRGADTLLARFSQ